MFSFENAMFDFWKERKYRNILDDNDEISYQLIFKKKKYSNARRKQDIIVMAK